MLGVKVAEKSREHARGMGVPPMKHGQDARATSASKEFCKSLQTKKQCCAFSW